jgi:flagellar capping protein FliD
MNISNLFGSGFSTSWKSHFSSSPAASESVKELSPLALAVQRADKRIQTEVDTNTAQLSSFGKLKSSVSDVQIAAKALIDLSGNDSSAAVKNAVSNLVSAFNASADIAKTTAALPGATDASQSAHRVGRDLHRAVSGDASISDALKDIGVRLHEGGLALDPKRLDAALTADPDRVRAVLAEIGQQIHATTSTELEANGNVFDSLNSLSQLARVLESQQSALQSAAQATSTAQSNRANGGRLAAYQSAMNSL